MKHQGMQETAPQKDPVLDLRVRGVGMQTTGLLEELKMLAGPVSKRPPAPRRIDPVYHPPTHSAIDERRVLPNRYLRRRYRELLDRIPILTYVPGRQGTNSDNPATSRYVVSLAANALSRHIQPETVHSSEVDAVDLAWFQRGNKNPWPA
jgi:hypothetical protein